jgi:hypothetical protein
LELFSGVLPYSSTVENIQNPDLVTSIEQEIKSSNWPFPDYPEQRPSQYVQVVKDCLNRDPFLRPISSHLAQLLFEIRISDASNNPEWGFRAPVVYVPSDEVRQLAAKVLEKAVQREEKHEQAVELKKRIKDNKGKQKAVEKPGETLPDKSQETLSDKTRETLPISTLSTLIRSAKAGDPSLSYVVGMGYLWSIIELEEETPSDVSSVPSKGKVMFSFYTI